MNNKLYSIIIKIVLMIIMAVGIILLIVFMFKKFNNLTLSFNNNEKIKNNTKKQYNKNDSIEKQIEDGLSIEYSQDTLSGLEEFDTVFFGEYAQKHDNDNVEPIEWIILSKNENTAILMSKYILDSKIFSKENELANWETSDIRKWLNEEFYNNAFNDDEKRKIISKTSENKTYKDRSFEIFQKDNPTSDNVYLLDIEEIKKYFGVEDFYSNNKKLTTYGTDRSKYFLTIRGDLDWANGNSYWIIRDSMRGSYSTNSKNGKTTYTLKGRQVMYLSATGSLTWATYNRNKLGIRPVINVKYK